MYRTTHTHESKGSNPTLRGPLTSLGGSHHQCDSLSALFSNNFPSFSFSSPLLTHGAFPGRKKRLKQSVSGSHSRNPKRVLTMKEKRVCNVVCVRVCVSGLSTPPNGAGSKGACVRAHPPPPPSIRARILFFLFLLLVTPVRRGTHPPIPSSPFPFSLAHVLNPPPHPGGDLSSPLHQHTNWK